MLKLNSKHYQKALNKLIKKNTRLFQEYKHWVNNHMHFFAHGRTYSEYHNLFFKKHLGNFFGLNKPLSVAEAFKLISSERKKLTLFEDGPGTGVFAENLKKELLKQGIESEINAIALNPNPELIEREKRKILNLKYGLSELFVPEKKYDGIISMVGSIDYSPKYTKRAHLMKLAFSLKKNGLMLIGLNSKTTNIITSRELIKIKKPLERNGFKVKEFRNELKSGENNPKNAAGLPEWGLIIQRK